MLCAVLINNDSTQRDLQNATDMTLLIDHVKLLVLVAFTALAVLTLIVSHSCFGGGRWGCPC